MRQNVVTPFLVIPTLEDFERLENQRTNGIFKSHLFPDHLQTPLPTIDARPKQYIEVPFTAAVPHQQPAHPNGCPSLETTYQIARSYLRANPINNVDLGCAYELQEEDLKFLSEYNSSHDPIDAEYLEQSIQYIELRRFYEKYVAFKPGEGVDPGRNFQRQWELLKTHTLHAHPPDDEIVAHYWQRTEKLERPLLRVFMRAIENDSRLSIAFRPTRPYKQKRLKRIGMPMHEFEVIEKRIRTENNVGLHCTRMTQQREAVKHQLLQIQHQEWLQATLEIDLEVPKVEPMVHVNISLLEESMDLQRKLKDLRISSLPSPLELIKSRSELQNTVPPYMKYQDCQIEDCQFNVFRSLPPTYLTPEVIDVMNDQYATMKWKVGWPENLTVLRHQEFSSEEDTLVIRPQSIIGHQSQGKTILVGTEDRTYILRETRVCKEDSAQKGNRKPRKAVNVALIDPKLNRMSGCESVRVDFEHFVSHRQTLMDRGLAEVEAMKKVCQKARLDLLRRERQIKLKLLKKKKKEELFERRRNILKIRLKLEDLAVKKPPITVEVPKTPAPIPMPIMSAQVSANKFVLRKFDPDASNRIKLQMVQESPSKFKLVCKAESPQTLKLQLGQESHESCSLETHPRNIFNLSTSKPIDEFKQIDL